jgi:hypothetical protein
MAQVDREDDSITRFIVHHYRYDPQRRERRNVVVAAFDSEAEYDACMREVREEIERRREAGEEVDPREHVTGTIYEPGSRRLAANGHLIGRALSHGVFPRSLQELELPSNMVVLSAESPPQDGRYRGRDNP